MRLIPQLGAKKVVRHAQAMLQLNEVTAQQRIHTVHMVHIYTLIIVCSSTRAEYIVVCGAQYRCSCIYIYIYIYMLHTCYIYLLCYSVCLCIYYSSRISENMFRIAFQLITQLGEGAAALALAQEARSGLKVERIR